MRSHTLSQAELRLEHWINRHNIKQAGVWALVGLGPLLAIATVAVLSEMQWLGSGTMLRPVLLADFVYALVVATFVLQRIAAMIADAAAALGGVEAAHAAGALLHR